MADWSFASRGLSLFPLLPLTKRPAAEALLNGQWEPYQTRRATPIELQVWADGPWNTGVATGAVSGVVVFEVDSLEMWALAVERGLPETLTVKSPRGWHFYFQHPGWSVPNRAGLRDLPSEQDPRGVRHIGWDIRGDGGYVVGPGSIYIPTPEEAAAGKVPGTYRIDVDAPPAALPEWLLTLLTPRAPIAPAAPRKDADETTPYGRNALFAELMDLRDSVPGTVNDQINAGTFAIAQLVGGGEIRADEAHAAILECLAFKGLDGEEKALGTMDRAWAAGIEHPRAAAAQLTAEQIFGVRETLTAVNGEGVPLPPSSEVEPPAPREDRAYSHVISAMELPAYFSGCVYVSELDKIFLPHGRFVSKSAFDTRYGGKEFTTRWNETGKLETSAWVAFRLNQCWVPPIADDVCFRPEHPPGSLVTVGNYQLLNTYVPAKVRRVRGDAGPFLDFLQRLLPVERDRQILLSYAAALVQNPGRKFQWWPVLQGAEGNGKTAILNAMAYAVGERYTHLVNPEAMKKTGNQFNSWIQGHLLIGIEEFHVEGSQRDFLNAFKTTVTNERIGIEGKGVSQATGDNRANGCICTNYRSAIPTTVDNRRYCIFFTAQQSAEDIERDGMGGTYFPRFYEWLRGDGYAIVAQYLLDYEPHAEFNPAGNCQRAPRTSSFLEVLAESMGRVEQEIVEAIEEGRMGFRGGVVSSKALTGLFEMKRLNVSLKRYPEIMATLGYVYHPGLRDGRASSPTRDGSKPRLYFVKGHAALEDVASNASGAYDAAQDAEGLPTTNVVPFPGRR